MLKKYLVIGGNIISKSDGEEHFISASRLCELYRVDPVECYLFSENPHLEIELRNLPKGLIVLQPKYNGDYSIPTSPSTQ